MRKYLLIVLVGLAQFLNAQTCYKCCYCTNTTYSLSSSTFSAGTTFGTLGNFQGGTYAICNVTNGYTYEWTTCNTYGGSHGTGFDPELTLFNSSGNAECFHDDIGGSGSCPTAAYLSWTANYTGYVYILVSNEWTSQCQNYTSSTAKVVWKGYSSCSTPSTPSISSASSITSSSFIANWSSVSGATSYILDVSTNSSFTSLVVNGFNTSGATSVTVTGCSSCSNYWYRVRATNSCGTSGNSSSASLTTSSGSLSTPSISSATNITSSGFTANWGSVSGASAYLIDVSTNSSFTALVINNANAGNATSADISGCNSGTTYYYRVRATNGCTTTGNSSYTSVTTTTSCTTPNTPSIGSATNVTASGFTATWNSVSGATSYLIDVSTNSSFTALVINGASAGNATTANISGCSANTTYWYRVRATNSCGTSGNSSSSSVTTSSSCSSPSAPSILSPSGIATSGFTAKWNSSSGATTYYVYVSTNSSFSSYVSGYNGVNVGNTNSKGISGLNCNTTYFYRVQAYNSCGYSGYSSYTSAKTSSCSAANSSSNAIQSPGNQQIIAEPIQVGTKTYMYRHTDVNIPVGMGSLSFTRYYNSLNQAKNSPIGYGWSHSYSYSIQNLNDTAWDVSYPDGHSSRFIPLANSGGLSFPLYPGTFDSLINLTSGDYWMFSKEMTIYKFDANGKLYSIVDANGNQTNLNYSGSNLTTVTSPGSRSLTFSYNSNAQIVSVTTPFNRLCKYGYDGNGDQIYSISPNGDTTYITYSGHKIITVTDPLKNVVLTNTYNGQGEMINQADAYNKNTSFAYNTPVNGDATVTLPDNSKSIYHHDSSYRLVKSIDPYNKVSVIDYDANNQPDSVTNELKQLSAFQYDNKGNPLVQSLPGKVTYTFKYNKFSKPTEIINPKGLKSNLVYDTKGNLLSINFPDNSYRYFAYNSDGTPKYFVDGNRDTIRFYYNSYGDLIKVGNSIGVINYEYDDDGRLVLIIDQRRNRTTIGYDNNSNIIWIKDALNQYLRFTYDKANQLIIFKNKRKCSTYFYYDKKGRVIARKNAIGAIDSFFYDSRDNLRIWKDALGHSTLYEYDLNGRRISIANFAGKVKYDYDAIGNVIKFTDANKKSIKLGYSDANLIDSISNALNQVNQFFYDSLGNLKKSTNYRGKSNNYKYDPMNRLTETKDVKNISTLYGRDLDGNLTSLKDGNQHTQNFVYGNIDLLESYKDGANNPYSFTYDSSGNTKTINKPIGSITYTYDPLNRVKTKKLSTGETSSYGYDENNNITSVTNALGTSYFFFDSLDRFVKYKDVFNQEVLYGYNLVNSVSFIIYSGKDSVNYKYDSANRLIKVTDWKKNNFRYEYDSTGKVTKLTYPTEIHADFKYDSIGRIVSKFTKFKNNTILYGQLYTYFADSVKEKRWGSFPAGLQSSQKTNKYEPNNGSLGDANEPFSNDANGNRIKQIKGKDTITYKYSINQHLLNMKADGIINSYGYDALGHRLSKKVGSDEIRYVLDLNGPISSPLQITNASGKIKANYIYGLGLLEQIDSAGNVLFYHFDARHNTIALTDKNDSVKATYTYLLYGTLTKKTGSINQPYTFLGEFTVEQETNTCYYVRARYYDASSGRFLNQDPLFGDEFDPQTLNRYVYCVNNPLKYYDITGLDKDETALNKFVNSWNDAYLQAINSLGLTFSELGNGFKEGYGTIVQTVKDPNTYYLVFTALLAEYAVGKLIKFIPIKPTITIRFGSVDNQISHATRHLAEAGYSTAEIDAIKRLILTDIKTIASEMNVGADVLRRKIIFNGKEIFYNSYRVADDLINIGRID